MPRFTAETWTRALGLLFHGRGGSVEASEKFRSVTLTVAALIAAVTFQAGVNPPGGVWQETNDDHIAGKAVYAANRQAFYVFLIFNTLALSSSILKIIVLTYGFPYYFEVVVATISMIITYGSAIFAVTPHGIDKNKIKTDTYKFRYLLFTAACPFLLRLVILVAYKQGFFRRSNSNRVVSAESPRPSPRTPISSID